MLRRGAAAIFVRWGLLFFGGMGAHPIACDLLHVKPGAPPVSRQILREKRSSGLDLEVRGDLAGLPAGSLRYIAREDLKALPQVTYTVTDDKNFGGAVEVRGVELGVLAREFAGSGEKALIVAVCRDLYRAHYPRGYVEAHRPVLVMEIAGEGPASWPKSKEGSDSAMGPYLISHPRFTPSFTVLGNEEEAQIPWGVVRLEFRNEEAIFGEIAPRAVNAGEAEEIGRAHV